MNNVIRRLMFIGNSRNMFSIKFILIKMNIKKQLGKILIALFVVTSILATANASDTATLDAKTVYGKMLSTRKSVETYSATQTLTTPAGTEKCRIIEMTDRNGDLFQRQESGTSIIIQSGKEKWMMFGNSAIKISYQTSLNHDFAKKNGDENKYKGLKNDPKKYSISEIIYENTPCYCVNIAYSDEYVNTITKMLDASNIVKNAKDFVPKEFRHYIQKNNYLLRGVEIYNIQGAKISETSYTNIKINEPLSMTLFEIPKNCKKYEVKSDSEMKILLKKIQDATIVSPEEAENALEKEKEWNNRH